MKKENGALKKNVEILRKICALLNSTEFIDGVDIEKFYNTTFDSTTELLDKLEAKLYKNLHE